MKKTIIILHGWNSEIKRWTNFSKLLSQKFLVYFPKLPGFQNFKLTKVWTLNDYSNWLKKYLDYKKIKNPVLIGHSFGGSIAIKYLSNNFKASKLILINSAGIRKEARFKQKIGFFLAKTGSKFFGLPFIRNYKNIAQKILYKILREKDYYLADQNLKKTLISVLKEDLTNKLTTIKIPTLILWGKLDNITPLKDGYVFCQKIANSKLKIWDKGTHALPFEYYKSVIKRIIEFIQ